MSASASATQNGHNKGGSFLRHGVHRNISWTVRPVSGQPRCFQSVGIISSQCHRLASSTGHH